LFSGKESESHVARVSRSSGGLFFRQWQKNLESTSLTQFTFYSNRAAMGLDNAENYGEAESSADKFIGEKGVKKHLNIVVGNATAGINDLYAGIGMVLRLPV